MALRVRLFTLQSLMALPMRTISWGLFLAASLFLDCEASAATKTENVFLITVDGLRWQEIFTGAEAALISKDVGGVGDTNRLAKQYWRDTAEERRRVLLPFFWETIAKKGQLYGNASNGSPALLTNGKKFTYPGFNEIFTGFADARIDKNEKRWNPNVSVFEWLHRKPAFAGRIVGFANWDVHTYILNSQRSGIPVWSGYDTNLPAAPGSRLELVQQLHKDTTEIWGEMSFDSFYFHAAQEYAREQQPRLVWLGLSETDEWAHEGRYDRYLHAANLMDRYVGKLWATLQTLPQYKDKTSFIITCDHGRGNGAEWRNHGASTVGAENIWIAIIGPDTRPLGDRSNIPPVTQSQIAATLAALLGEDYQAAVPAAAAPIANALPPDGIK
jgi:hypothetical protein